MENRPLIVGAGPTGLAAALFLAMRGVPSRIVDQAAAPETESRALAVNPRTLELLAPTGCVEPMLAEGHAIHRTCFYSGWERIADIEFGDAHPLYPMLILPQARTVQLLTDALARHGLHPEFNTKFEGLAQDESSVMARLAHAGGDRETVRAPILLGADGAHSLVREALGIAFAGTSFPEPWPLYDLHLDDPFDFASAHVSFVKHGLIFLLALRPGLWRLFGDVPDLLDRLPPGTVRGEMVWQASFHISHHLVEREVQGRVVLAGDAAHIHSPVAARGMNLGIEDAFVFADCAVDALAGRMERLADYGRLRRAVHQSVISRVKTLTELARGRPDIVGWLRGMLIPGLTKFPPTAHAMLDLLTGLDHPVETH